MAGNHGDEYEGQIAVSNLARQLDPAEICGRIILLPMVNFPAAQAGLRTSPVDEGNLNRLFPGNAMGSPTEIIAHYVEDVLMPMADYAIDLHSGGNSLYYPPHCYADKGKTPRKVRRCCAFKTRLICLMLGSLRVVAGAAAQRALRWEQPIATA
jgi:predicted deacylase